MPNLLYGNDCWTILSQIKKKRLDSDVILITNVQIPWTNYVRNEEFLRMEITKAFLLTVRYCV